MPSRADVHVHTKYSGLARLLFVRFPESISEPRDIVKQANRNGLSVVCVTDHNTVKGGLKAAAFAKEFPGTEVVVGEEVGTKDGEVIGLFLNEDIPQGLSAEETIERIRGQGGLTIAPHPFSMHVSALGTKVDALDLDGLEVLNAGHVDGYANMKADQYSRSGRWARLGGSDSHVLNTIGCAQTVFQGNSAEDFRREILDKRTDAAGQRQPMIKVVGWSMGVIAASDRVILRSLVGIKETDDNPAWEKVEFMRFDKKLLALAGSFVYFLPPLPFIAEIVGEWRLRVMNSVPVHEENVGGLV
jgi:predicted metal-dependent phosphoesterase TrpH